MPKSRQMIAALTTLSAMGMAAPAHAQSWAEHWFDNVTYTSPGSFEDQARGYVTAGGFSGRVDVHNDYLMSVTLPKVSVTLGLKKMSPLLSRMVLLSRANLSLSIVLNMPNSAVMP